MKNQLLKNLRLRRLLIAVVVVGTLFFVKMRLNRFPYVGTWSGQNIGKNKVKTTINFYPNNACSWHLDNEINGKPNPLNYACSYTMHSGSARVELRLSNAQFVNGQWRFARTSY